MTTRPKKTTRPTRNPNEQLLRDCHTAMTEALDDWNTPDSPEAFAFSMKGIMVLRDRIAARFNITDPTGK